MLQPEWFPATRFKTQHLLLVSALAKHGSVLHAAEALNMTQPTCSKLLHQLEASVGTALFKRHARGVEPTEAGTVMVAHARAALTELRHAHETIGALRSGLAGHVAIGTEATSATTLVPQAVALVKHRFPRVTISIELAFSELLVERLRAGALDIAVARLGSLEDQAEFRHEPLPAASHVIAARGGHPLAERGSLTWRDLQDQSWVLPPTGNVMRTSLTLLFRQRGLPLPTQMVETAALPVTIALLTASDMVAPLPANVVAPYRASGQLCVLPVPPDLRLQPAAIITRAEAIMPAASAMLNALREAARTEPID